MSIEPIQKENIPRLVPDSQFPEQAIQESVQTFPPPGQGGGFLGSGWFTINLATAADTMPVWGVDPWNRDRRLTEFWQSEPYLAGALSNVCRKRAALEWEIIGPSEKVIQAVTDMLLRAIGRDGVGWTRHEIVGTQDLYGTDNGRFRELIRDPGMDAASKFKDEKAPVIGVAHLDSSRCQRTGNMEFPVIYTDMNGAPHKLAWFQVICMSDFPSARESMNGVGFCGVSRTLQLARIMRSILLFKDEKIGGRHIKQIHFVSGVSRTEIEDEKKRTQEQANNQGQTRFVMPAILASLDPEKPVSTASIDLAGFPEGFNYDEEMKWYINGLALSFGEDYQEFAPLPGGNLGSGGQSEVLHKKSSAKEQSIYMRSTVESFEAYGVLPRGYTMRYNDKNEQEELEKQMVRTKAAEEYAIDVRNGILSPEAVRADAQKRGIYDKEIIEMMEKEYGLDIVNPSRNNVGQIGGNTRAEDAARTETGKPGENKGDRLRKMVDKLKVWKR